MKLFECQKCGQLLHFENTRCESCGSQLGYLRARETLSVVEPEGDVWRALAEPDKRYRFCANTQYGVCNWMVDDIQPSSFCAACRHNQTIPDLSIPENVARWRQDRIRQAPADLYLAQAAAAARHQGRRPRRIGV
jgi:hypothetical protein